MDIEVTLDGLRPYLTTPAEIVCGNEGYHILTTFSDDWNVNAWLVIKSRYHGAEESRIAISIAGDAEIPVIENAEYIEITWKDAQKASEPLIIPCKASVTSEPGEAVGIKEDVYNWAMGVIHDRTG